MLTIDWFKEALPKAINNQQDYDKLVVFITTLMDKAGNLENLQKFIKNLDTATNYTLSYQLAIALKTFLDFQLKRLGFMIQIYKDNQQQLSTDTKTEITKYCNVEFDKSKTILDILNSILNLFLNEKGE